MRRIDWLPQLVEDLELLKNLLYEVYMQVDTILSDPGDERDYVINTLSNLYRGLDEFRPVADRAYDFINAIGLLKGKDLE